MRRLLSVATIVWTMAMAGPAAAAAGDAFAEGYATAVLAERFGMTPRALIVRDGVVTLPASDLAGLDQDAVLAALRSVRGIVRVEIAGRVDVAGSGRAERAGLAGGAPGAATATPTPAEADGAARAAARPYAAGGMPGDVLFRPLVADPRWPHFSAAHHYYVGDPDFRNVASVSFGETFALYRWDLDPRWLEIGIQAGVFSIFDLDAESFDLINADYFVAAFLGYRQGAFSALARLFHQSSHLGDEFLLRRSQIDRVNLSYEGLDAKVSYELWEDALRPYVGAGYLVRREPADVEPWFVQYGVEFRSPWPRTARFRPIAAADIQHREVNDWDADISLRAGVQLGSALQTRNMQLLLEYFNGRSFNGQFYRRQIDYLGIGVHFHF